ncbi:MAG TPA: TerC family protein [Terriglobales bacterium]|nr:TerC family protein [Terriglobales bacterium]
MVVFWILFNLFVLAMLALDLGVLNRGSSRLGVRRALIWSAIWIMLAAIFALLVLSRFGRPEALQFVTAYVIELSLSVDNLFLFLLIFRYFSVPEEHQHKVLFAGILGALVMRGVFITTGVSLLLRFRWIIYAFGALLVYSGIKLLRHGAKEIQPEKNIILRLFRRAFPVTKEYVGGQFFTRKDSSSEGERLYATPLLVALLMVETSDILFAVDSIPAVLAITLNAFIVYTSNVFAILGLRSMYFALAGMMDRFQYLHYGLSAVLIFVGVKMLASHSVNIPTEWTLTTVLVVLGVSILASLLHRQDKPVT